MKNMDGIAIPIIIIIMVIIKIVINIIPSIILIKRIGITHI